MRRYIIILVLMIFLQPVSGCAEGVGTLIQVGKSMDQIQRSYDKQTAAYDRVKEAIDKGEIKKDVTQEAVLKIGEPVVVVSEVLSKRQVWVYSPGTTDLLNKPKIRLFFDKDGTLDEVSVLE